jgi:UDP-N-acetylglucosamine transferase subunit ALG13
VILIVLGTQKFQLNRLLKNIDELVGQGIIDEEVYAQRGYSNYVPKHYESIEFLNKDEFERKIAECSLVIAHSGVGTIISAIGRKKPVIVCPRLKKYKEHVDNHQVEIARTFQKRRLVLTYNDGDDLYALILKSKHYKFESYTTERERIINIISGYLGEEIKNV